tara:strand:+ start:8936 stop:9400 length:465 start_codon:yes stop_codon:yes gene_type:complete
MTSPPYFFQKSTSPCWYALLVVLSSILTACGDATARAEIESVSRVWEASLLAGQPSKAVSEVFTKDALRLPAGEEAVRGQPAIVEALAGSARLTEARFIIKDLEVEGNLAFANGTYRVRAVGGEELTGKFLEVWKKSDQGWRIHRVMWDQMSDQ